MATGERVLLFDGVCNLCEGSVQFVIRRDPHAQFRFAALQSEAARRILSDLGLPTDQVETMVLIEGGRALTRSTGALRVARRLSGLWPLLYGFIIVPRFIRDGVYSWIARNRYRWFGRKDHCLVPTPDLKARFLDQDANH